MAWVTLDQFHPNLDDETDPEDEIDDTNGIDGDKATENARDHSWRLRCPPTVDAARKALSDLRDFLKPQRENKTRTGHLNPKLNPGSILCEHLCTMKDFLVVFTNPKDKLNPAGGQWRKAALQTAIRLEKGKWFVQSLCQWTKQYINDRVNLPLRKPSQTISRIKNEELAADIQIHLQSIGKYTHAMDIVHYLEDLLVQRRHGLKKHISLSTAQRWMGSLGY